MEFDILDNEKYIYNLDKGKLIDVLLDFPNQFKKAEKIIKELKIKLRDDYKNVAIFGTGNPSTTAYKLIESSDINKFKLPIIFCPTGKIPAWVNQDTLVIIISHSGDTLEVLEAFDKASEKGLEIVVITAGGKLKAKASANNKTKLIEYHAPLLPRMAIGYAYVLLVNVLTSTKSIGISGIEKDRPFGLSWDDVENELFQFTRELIPENKIYKNTAKKIAINLYDKIPIIYGMNKITGTVAYRLKTQLCTVSKIFAHYNTLPEVYHDEIVGLEMRPGLREKFFALLITDKNEPDINKKRTELLKGIFIEKDIDFEEIAIEGTNDVVKGFKGIFLADWISLYLAILNRVDPNAITLVDVIKKRLEQIDKS